MSILSKKNKKKTLLTKKNNDIFIRISLLHSNFPSNNNLQNFDNDLHPNFEKNSRREEIIRNNKVEQKPKKKIKKVKTKKSKKKDVELENLKNLKEITDNEELFTYRNNIKNTYINKINSLVSDNMQNIKKMKEA